MDDFRVNNIGAVKILKESVLRKNVVRSEMRLIKCVKRM